MEVGDGGRGDEMSRGPRDQGYEMTRGLNAGFKMTGDEMKVDEVEIYPGK
jgi:hypothetical protein